MTARPFHPSMNRRRRELPGWVLALVALLVVVATAAVEGSSPGALAAFFQIVGQVALVVLVAIVVVVIAGLWLAVLVYGWRHMDGER